MATKIYATGRRKTSVARVFLIPNGKGKIEINGKELEKYFPANYVSVVKEPLVLTETLSKFDIYATVKGGGLTGQAEALRHGISRCLDKVDREKYHKILKSKGSKKALWTQKGKKSSSVFKEIKKRCQKAPFLFLFSFTSVPSLKIIKSF